MPLTERGRRILLSGFAAIGYLLLARILLVEGIADAGGIGGIDAVAYWTAAGNAMRGLPLYEHAGFAFGTYQYPPPFAQVLAPASLLPLPAFVWLWRGLELLGLRIATGTWTRTGLAILLCLTHGSLPCTLPLSCSGFFELSFVSLSQMRKFSGQI